MVILESGAAVAAAGMAPGCLSTSSEIRSAIYSLHTNGGASTACAKINYIILHLHYGFVKVHDKDIAKFGVGPRRSMCLYF